MERFIKELIVGIDESDNLQMLKQLLSAKKAVVYNAMFSELEYECNQEVLKSLLLLEPNELTIDEEAKISTTFVEYFYEINNRNVEELLENELLHQFLSYFSEFPNMLNLETVNASVLKILLELSEIQEFESASFISDVVEVYAQSESEVNNFFCELLIIRYYSEESFKNNASLLNKIFFNSIISVKQQNIAGICIFIMILEQQQEEVHQELLCDTMSKLNEDFQSECYTLNIEEFKSQFIYDYLNCRSFEEYIINEVIREFIRLYSNISSGNSLLLFNENLESAIEFILHLLSLEEVEDETKKLSITLLLNKYWMHYFKLVKNFLTQENKHVFIIDSLVEVLNYLIENASETQAFNQFVSEGYEVFLENILQKEEVVRRMSMTSSKLLDNEEVLLEWPRNEEIQLCETFIRFSYINNLEINRENENEYFCFLCEQYADGSQRAEESIILLSEQFCHFRTLMESLLFEQICIFNVPNNYELFIECRYSLLAKLLELDQCEKHQFEVFNEITTEQFIGIVFTELSLYDSLIAPELIESILYVFKIICDRQEFERADFSGNEYTKQYLIQTSLNSFENLTLLQAMNEIVSQYYNIIKISEPFEVLEIQPINIQEELPGLRYHSFNIDKMISLNQENFVSFKEYNNNEEGMHQNITDKYSYTIIHFLIEVLFLFSRQEIDEISETIQQFEYIFENRASHELFLNILVISKFFKQDIDYNAEAVFNCIEFYYYSNRDISRLITHLLAAQQPQLIFDNYNRLKNEQIKAEVLSWLLENISIEYTIEKLEHMIQVLLEYVESINDSYEKCEICRKILQLVNLVLENSFINCNSLTKYFIEISITITFNSRMQPSEFHQLIDNILIICNGEHYSIEEIMLIDNSEFDNYLDQKIKIYQPEEIEANYRNAIAEMGYEGENILMEKYSTVILSFDAFLCVTTTDSFLNIIKLTKMPTELIETIFLRILLTYDKILLENQNAAENSFLLEEIYRLCCCLFELLPSVDEFYFLISSLKELGYCEQEASHQSMELIMNCLFTQCQALFLKSPFIITTPLRQKLCSNVINYEEHISYLVVHNSKLWSKNDLNRQFLLGIYEDENVREFHEVSDVIADFYVNGTKKITSAQLYSLLQYIIKDEQYHNIDTICIIPEFIQSLLENNYFIRTTISLLSLYYNVDTITGKSIVFIFSELLKEENFYVIFLQYCLVNSYDANEFINEASEILDYNYLYEGIKALLLSSSIEQNEFFILLSLLLNTNLSRRILGVEKECEEVQLLISKGLCVKSHIELFIDLNHIYIESCHETEKLDVSSIRSIILVEYQIYAELMLEYTLFDITNSNILKLFKLNIAQEYHLFEELYSNVITEEMLELTDDYDLLLLSYFTKERVQLNIDEFLWKCYKRGSEDSIDYILEAIRKNFLEIENYSIIYPILEDQLSKEKSSITVVFEIIKEYPKELKEFIINSANLIFQLLYDYQSEIENILEELYSKDNFEKAFCEYYRELLILVLRKANSQETEEMSNELFNRMLMSRDPEVMLERIPLFEYLIDAELLDFEFICHELMNVMEECKSKQKESIMKWLFSRLSK